MTCCVNHDAHKRHTRKETVLLNIVDGILGAQGCYAGTYMVIYIPTRNTTSHWIDGWKMKQHSEMARKLRKKVREA